MGDAVIISLDGHIFNITTKRYEKVQKRLSYTYICCGLGVIIKSSIQIDRINIPCGCLFD